MMGFVKRKRFYIGIIIVFTLIFLTGISVHAQDLNIPYEDIIIETTENPESMGNLLQIFLLLSLITLIPSLILVLTCFTRVIVVLHFLRTAMGTQTMPPNQIMVGVALILTLYVMGPTFGVMYDNAILPFSRQEIGLAQALQEGMEPLREFMFLQAEDKDMALFAGLEGQVYATYEEIPNRVLVPAFVLGELSKGFRMGFFIYIPFIVIDMVVASVLMAMGMMMLPPAMISMPFKLLLFVMVDGWNLVLDTILKTIR